MDNLVIQKKKKDNKWAQVFPQRYKLHLSEHAEITFGKNKTKNL